MGRGDDVTLTTRRSAARTNRRSGGPVPRIAEREITITSGTDDARESASEQAVFVAVVHAVDGVRFTAAAPSRRELVHRVAEYVQRWGGYVLRPDHARHLRGLLARGEWEAAVELYFAVVGKRWDKEWLVTAALPSGRPREGLAELGEVVALERRGAPRPTDADIEFDRLTPHERAG